MNLIPHLIVSSIGLGYFIYGKKVTDFSFLIIGMVMMIYPYVVKGPVLSVVIGLVLCGLPFILKKL